jgi:hypothetical protein
MSNMGNVPIRPTISNGAIVLGQSLPVIGVPVQLAPLNKDTGLVVVQIQNGNVYATFDGTDPEDGNGHILYANNSFNWNPATARSAKFMQVSGSARIMAQEFMTAGQFTCLNNTDVVQTQ